jgi:hypothetical protein
MQKKYVMANIRLPIEVLPDGNIHPLPEYISIDIDECSQLPSQTNSLSLNSEINRKITLLCGLMDKSVSKEPAIDLDRIDPLLFVTKDEIENRLIKPRKSENNHTLKIFHRQGSRHKTEKRYG